MVSLWPPDTEARTGLLPVYAVFATDQCALYRMTDLA